MKKPLAFIIVNITVILILSLVQVVVANSISTTGIELGKIQQDIAEFKKQNAVLHEQVLLSSSFTNIASRAGELGFVEGKSRLVISSPLPLARQ